MNNNNKTSVGTHCVVDTFSQNMLKNKKKTNRQTKQAVGENLEFRVGTIYYLKVQFFNHNLQ